MKLGGVEYGLSTWAFYRGLGGVLSLVVIHASLIAWTPSQCGLPDQVGVLDALRLALDNALHGLLLDFFEIYDVNLAADPARHSWVSGGVFLLFRLAVDGLALLAAVGLYRYCATQRLLRRAGVERSSNVLLALLRQVSGGGEAALA